MRECISCGCSEIERREVAAGIYEETCPKCGYTAIFAAAPARIGARSLGGRRPEKEWWED